MSIWVPPHDSLNYIKDAPAYILQRVKHFELYISTLPCHEILCREIERLLSPPDTSDFKVGMGEHPRGGNFFTYNYLGKDLLNTVKVYEEEDFDPKGFYAPSPGEIREYYRRQVLKNLHDIDKYQRTQDSCISIWKVIGRGDSKFVCSLVSNEGEKRFLLSWDGQPLFEDTLEDIVLRKSLCDNIRNSSEWIVEICERNEVYLPKASFLSNTCLEIQKNIMPSDRDFEVDVGYNFVGEPYFIYKFRGKELFGGIL